jgi:hypothetical protein
MIRPTNWRASIIFITLIGAHGAQLARTDTVVLPDGTRSVYISEQEPEITHLEKVSVKVGSAEEILAKNVIMRPGSSKEFPIPEHLRRNV